MNQVPQAIFLMWAPACGTLPVGIGSSFDGSNGLQLEMAASEVASGKRLQIPRPESLKC